MHVLFKSFFSIAHVWTTFCAPFSPFSYNFYSMAKQLNATGRPDENFSVEVNGPLFFSTHEAIQDKRLLSIFLQKGQLRSNICYNPGNLTNLEVPYWHVCMLLANKSFYSIVNLREAMYNFLDRCREGSQFAT